MNRHGFSDILIAHNGQEAVDLYYNSETKPDVIIMDYRMPKKNGIEATKEILNLNNKVKIIFATADDSIKKEVSLLGVFSILIKPFNISSLIENVKKALENHLTS